jgi:O-antigen ligase
MSFIIAIATIAGLVWGTWFLLRGSLLAGCLIFLVTACCFSHTFLEFDLGPLPLTLDRVALVLLVGTYVVQRRQGTAEPKSLLTVDWLVLALAAVLAMSTFSHDWRVSRPGEISPVWRLLFGYLMPMTLYWVARQSPLDERRLGWMLATLSCFGVYLAVTGIAEITQQWWLVFPKYIADPAVGIHFGRARGPMVQAACYGTALAICLMCAWMWRERLGRGGQLALIATLPLFAAALFFTYTRSAWAESLLGMLVVLALTLKGKLRGAVLGTIVAAAGIVAVANWDQLVGFKREQSADETRKSAHMRGSFAYVSWKMFQDRPLLGCGFGHYRTEVLPYLGDRTTELDLESIRGYVHHNTWLCILAENGLVGMLLFFGIIALWARAAWRLYRNPLSPAWVRSQAVLMLAVLTIHICQALSRDVTYTAIENMLLFLMAGITTGLAARLPAKDAVLATARGAEGLGTRGWGLGIRELR